MTFPCVHCGATETAVLRSRINSGGKRWRMMHCKACGKTSEYINGKPRDMTAGHNRPFYKFSDATLRKILLTKCSNSIMAEQVGCSCELVRQIRRGNLHINRVPEIPRWGENAPPPVINGPSCLVCVNRAGGDGPTCGMGFPDPDEEGPGFAADCSLFAKERC